MQTSDMTARAVYEELTNLLNDGYIIKLIPQSGGVQVVVLLQVKSVRGRRITPVEGRVASASAGTLSTALEDVYTQVPERRGGKE